MYTVMLFWGGHKKNFMAEAQIGAEGIVLLISINRVNYSLKDCIS